jgi:twitching motility protein PilU
MEVSELKGLLDLVLSAVVHEGASDVYIRADYAPVLRIQGQLAAVEMDPFTPEMTEKLALSLMPPYMREGFDKNPEANFVYQKPELGRFRANAYRQRGTVALVFRKIKDDILDFETLGIHPMLKQKVMEKQGMVIITGPTGSGKSTTLAAMINHRNNFGSGHIITIEDPVEFVYYDKNCIISQREVGTDTMSFQNALENALRQAPDLMLIGEMRDLPSVKAAVYFSETGHLVLSTLHANSVFQTVERILQFFPPTEHEQVLQQLSLNLKAIAAQRLIPKKDGSGRILAMETLVVNVRMRDLIAKGELNQIKRELDMFLPEGMQSFEHALIEMFKQEIISAEECMKYSDNAQNMRLKLKGLGVATDR